jgi:hypothetical protein
VDEELVIRTIPVWNLSIRRTRRPGVDIMCRNKELVLESGTRSRKFLDVAQSESGRISFPASRGYDALIAFPRLDSEGDGRSLIKISGCAEAM